LARVIQAEIARQQVAIPPPAVVTRELVDYPVCTPAEYANVLSDFETQLEEIVSFCERIGSLAILIIPASNDAGFDPDRSVLAHDAGPAERAAFATSFRAVRQLEESDPDHALAQYRALVARHPEFAETHFRIGRLLERSKLWDEARQEYLAARNLDGMPMRCPSAFEEAYRRVAARHPRAILVDSPRILRAHSAHGILDDHHLHDAQHPTLQSYVLLAQDVLDQLRIRSLFRWPDETPTPMIDPWATAAHFGLDREKWRVVSTESKLFYEAMAYIRYDPEARLAKAKRYAHACDDLSRGMAPEQLGIEGLGLSRAGWLEPGDAGKAAVTTHAQPAMAKPSARP
jgi:hypothetical protein